MQIQNFLLNLNCDVKGQNEEKNRSLVSLVRQYLISSPFGWLHSGDRDPAFFLSGNIFMDVSGQCTTVQDDNACFEHQL